VGTFGGVLVAMGLGSIVMAALFRTLRDVEPDPRVSDVRQTEARRSSAEIQRLLVPWMWRLGFAAVLVGAALVVLDLIV
jgi:hypothetical protein